MEGACGLDGPVHPTPRAMRLPQGSRPVRMGLLPWLRCVLQPRPALHRESRAEIGLGDLQGAWQFFNILGLFPALSSAYWRSGRGGRSLAPGPWPLGARRVCPAGLRGRRGCGSGRLLPHPQWRRAHTGIFAGVQAAWCLIGLIHVVRGTVGKRMDGLAGVGLCWRVLTAVPVGFCPWSAPSWPLLLILWGPAAQPCVAGRGGS